MSNTHFIQKQYIEFVFRSQDAAEDQWNTLLDFHKQVGYQVMSDVFDQLVPDMDWIRIESLQIDLGTISRQSFRLDYPDLLRNSLEKALSTAILNKKQAVKANLESVWETNIIHYLKYGTFLWETAMLSPDLISDIKYKARDILEEKITERVLASGSFVQLLAFTLRQHNNAIKRWIRQFSPEFHRRIKNILLGQTENTLQLIIEKSCNLIESFITDKQVYIGDWYESSQAVKWNILFSGSSYSALALIKEWIVGQSIDNSLEESVLIILEKGTEAHKAALVANLAEYPHVFNRESSGSFLIPQLLEIMITNTLKALNIQTEISDQSENLAPAKHGPEKIPVKQNKNFNTELKSLEELENVLENNSGTMDYIENENQNYNNIPVDQEIYIENAGMVLLAPFIEQFFIQLGINTANLMDDDEGASLGIQMLQLLVTNTWDAEEHRFALNKILCGRTPEWPACRIKKIPDKAKLECHDLLQSLLLHWPATKSTSVEALQETYLQRQGKLVFKESHWQLWIEYKTQDILLESLTWSFSVIKLPWMQFPLYVTW